MVTNFIKIVNPDTAKELAGLGFQYIKEQDVFVFSYSDEIMMILNQKYSGECFVKENKLRF